MLKAELFDHSRKDGTAKLKRFCVLEIEDEFRGDCCARMMRGPDMAALPRSATKSRRLIQHLARMPSDQIFYMQSRPAGMPLRLRLAPAAAAGAE